MLSSVEAADEGAYSCRMSSDEVSTTSTMLYVIGEYGPDPGQNPTHSQNKERAREVSIVT